MVLAVVGLVRMVLSTVADYAGPALYLGLGAGGMERVATYPAPLWLLWTCRTGAVTRDQPPAALRRRVPAFPGPRIPDPVFAVERVWNYSSWASS
jgi:hypothetical protein